MKSHFYHTCEPRGMRAYRERLDSLLAQRDDVVRQIEAIRALLLRWP